MAPKFYSKEWVDACIEKTNTDKEYQKKTEKLNASYSFIVADCPDGNDIYVLIRFAKGKVVEHEYEVKPVPASFRMENEPWDESISLMRAQASYDTYVKINKKELTAMGAVTAGLYKSEGNMVKAMSLIPYTQAFAELQATVDCEY
jgi:hypothetical protein